MISKPKTVMIETRDLCKSFGNNKVLQGINLSIQKGESLAIIGTSGSGKSVLIKNIVGLLDPDSGTVRIKGKNVLSLNDKQRGKFNHKFGMLFQGAALFDSMNVYENIAFGLRQNTKMSEDFIRETVYERIKDVGLMAASANKMPSELSGGMKKRVGNLVPKTDPRTRCNLCR